MKTLGIIGGMSWESTALYYQHLNREVGRRLGGLHSAPLLMASVDFAEIAALQRSGEWARLAAMLSDAARRLQAAGAQALLIATNTMHKVAPEVAAAVQVPLLHIGDSTAAAIRAQGLQKVGLLGTRFTMTQPFLVDHLGERGVSCVVPDEAGRDEVHRIIFEELCRGRVEKRSRGALLEVCEGLRCQGAQAIVLGCTELTMLIDASHTELPLFDTTRLHALTGAEFILGD